MLYFNPSLCFRLNSQMGTSAIDNQWISQASARQRKGRAGRTSPGECFHMYTQTQYEAFDQFPIPEVHRVRLEPAVLTSKVFSFNLFLTLISLEIRNENFKASKKLVWL